MGLGLGHCGGEREVVGHPVAAQCAEFALVDAVAGNARQAGKGVGSDQAPYFRLPRVAAGPAWRSSGRSNTTDANSLAPLSARMVIWSAPPPNP